MTKRKFWPLDFDPEGEIYENVAWDLPGYKRTGKARAATTRRPTQKRSRA
jgi:hypothetical protein